MESPYAAVYAVAFSPDSSCLASASEGFTIRFWDTTSDKFREIRQADTRGTILIGLLFSPDGEWLASWSRSWSRPEVEMRNAKTGDCIYRITLEERVPLGSEIRFAFSSDSQRILVGSEQPGIWDVSGRTWINHLEVFPDRLLTSASSSEGTWVGHVYGENGHSIWNISETESVRMAEFLREDGFALPPSGQYAPGKAMPSSHRPSAISDDGTQIATCTESPFRLAIVDAITGAASYSDPQIARGTGNGLPELMTWSADSQWLAVAGIEGIGQIKIWDPKAIKNSSKTHEVHKSMRAMAFTADGRRFACGYEDGIIEIQDMASPGITLLTLEGHDSCVQAVVFSPSGNMLATQCAFLVKIWNIEATEECLHTFAAGQIDLRLAILPPSWPMAFSTDDSHFAFGQGENAIEVHGLTEQSMYQLKMDDITSLIFLPNRLSLAAGDKGRNIKIWDLGTKDTQERMFESDSWSLGLAFSSDGNLLAQSTTAGQIFLWEMSTGDCLCKLETEGQIRQLSFSPDDKSFMTEHGRLIPEHWPCNIDSRSNETREDDNQEDDSQEDDTQNDPIEVPFISQGYGIGFDGTWLTKDGERLVWLPPEHRQGLGFEQYALVAGSVVAIRNSSNQLSMYHFDH
jgi:WD40 repeat protein